MGLPPHIHAIYDAVMEGRYEYSLTSPEGEHCIVVVRREGPMVAFDEWARDGSGAYFYVGLTHYPCCDEYRVVEGYQWRGWTLTPRA